MQEYKIILTRKTIYNVTDIADYIEEEFGQQHADRFQSKHLTYLHSQMSTLPFCSRQNRCSYFY